MTDWCFVHAADTHLDTPMKGLGRLDPELQRRVVDASLEAFSALVDLAVDRDAAFLVVAGDVYDGADRGLRAAAAVRDGARRLAEHGIRLLLAHGNHDPVGTGYHAYTDLPDNVTVFRPDDPEHVRVERDGELLAVVSGVSYAEQAETRNLALRFHRTDEPVPHVAVLHANVGSNGAHAPYAPATVEDLRASGHDYWALGHVHQRQDVATPQVHGFRAHYPGNLQGRSPKHTEQGAKGASVVPVTTDHATGHHVVGAPEFVALDRVRWAQADVAIDEATTLGGLTDRLAAAAVEQHGRADGRLLLLRARLTGSGPLSLELAAEGRLDELRGVLQDRVPWGHDVVWTGVRDRTGPPRETPDVAPQVEVLAEVEVDEAALWAEVDTVVSRVGLDAAEDYDEVDDVRLDRDAVLAEARRVAERLLHGEDA